MMKHYFQIFTRSKFCQTGNAYFIIFAHFKVVIFIYKGKCQHSLFLQIRFVNAGKRFNQNGFHVEMARLHSSMLAAASFSVVFLGHYHRSNAFCFVSASQSRYSHVLSGCRVKCRICLFVESIHCTYEHIVRDVVKVTSEPKPRTSHRNVVGGTFSLHFDEQWKCFVIFPVPGSERLQFL